MRAPRFLTEVWSGVRQHPRLSLGLFSAVGLLTAWQLLPGPETKVEPPRPATQYTGALPSSVGLEGAIGTMQHRVREMELVMNQQRTTIERLQSELQQREAQNSTLLRQQQDAQNRQNDRIEATLRQAQALAAAQRVPAVTQAALPPMPPPKSLAPALRIIEADPPPKPVSAPGLPEIFLPAGSVAKGRLINGVFATTVQGGGIPAEFAIDTDFQSAQGTTVPLSGCRAGG